MKREAQLRSTVYFLSKVTGQQLGGQLIRSAQADLFRELGYRVRVVAPWYGAGEPPADDATLLIPSRMPLRVGSALQHVGIIDDYLNDWARRTIRQLSGLVGADDLVFASSGGELSCLSVGSKLQRLTGCRYVANLHDPIAYSRVDGVRVGRWLHVSRDRWEREYLENANLVITSTRAYGAALARKYPALTSRIRHAYFGYVEALPVVDRRPRRPLQVCYGGTFLRIQSPERLAEVAVEVEGVNAVFIGSHESYRPLHPFRSDVTLLPAMNHAAYNDYLMRYVDVGFVSLADNQFRYCVPSKIFEYINAGIPILGALPRGEAASLINDAGYGIAMDFGDDAGLQDALRSLTDSARWNSCRSRILEDRAGWSLVAQQRGVFEEVLGLIAA
jgi:hypothetical protein